MVVGFGRELLRCKVRWIGEFGTLLVSVGVGLLFVDEGRMRSGCLEIVRLPRCYVWNCLIMNTIVEGRVSIIIHSVKEIGEWSA